jgi:hypothetical protein
MLSRLVCFLLFAIPVLARQQEHKGSVELVEVSPDEEGVEKKVEEDESESGNEGENEKDDKADEKTVEDKANNLLEIAEEGLEKNETSDDGVEIDKANEGSQTEGSHREGWLEWLEKEKKGERVGKRDESSNEDLIPEDIDESDTLPITYSLIGVRR